MDREMVLSGSAYGVEEGSCEDGNKPSDSMQGGEFFDWLSDCQLLKTDFSLWS
jgi:hypothetical protein